MAESPLQIEHVLEDQVFSDAHSESTSTEAGHFPVV